MAACSVIKRILTSIPGSQAAAQSLKTPKSGASYIIASNLILDSCWFLESNKCQEFYEGRQEANKGARIGVQASGELN